MDSAEWPSSNKYWLYNHECKSYAKLVERIKAHSEMEGWSVKDLGKQPMEFVATNRAIYGHLLRQEDARNINLATCLPTHFFFASSGVKCLKSWVSAKKAEYEEQDEEEW